MSRLTATMVVDLTDKTGGKTRAIIGNLDRLKRAERDYMLADKGLRLSNRDRAMERLMMERERSIAERQASIMAWGARAGMATAALGYGAVQAYRSSAELEREIGRIVINADKGRDAIDPIVKRLRSIADDNRMPFENVVDGFRTLISSGRELEEALEFLPSVALTAQASGSAVADIGLTADAVAGALKVSAGDMQKAFDQLVKGGKLGKFELNEMAQYLPTIAPAFAALGYEGTEGLAKLVAMLQTVRMQTGTSAEAATNFENVINKIYSSETARKFEKNFGINLPKALDETRKRGGDVLETFLQLTSVATKGDLTKLSMIFEDAQAQKGLRALMMLGGEYRNFVGEIRNSSGTARQDAGQIFADSQSNLDRLSNNWNTFVDNVGRATGTVLNPVLEGINQKVSDADARRAAVRGVDPRDQVDMMKEFHKLYREVNPDTNLNTINMAFREALEKVGRGQAATVFDELRAEQGRRSGGAIMDRYLTGSGGRNTGLQGIGAGPATGRAPMPGARPSGASGELGGSAGILPYQGYPSRGVYDPALVRAQGENARQQGEAGRWAREGAAGPGWIDQLKNLIVGSDASPKPVTLSGSPQVTITNPPPRPNVSVQMSVVINEAQNADAVANQLRDRIHSELNGMQGPLEYGGL
jgi:TP901 family phage tail tape measure protein